MIFMHVPSVPPSVNQAYATARGHRILTKEGHAYKTNTKTYIARAYPTLLRWFSPDDQYVVLIRLLLAKDDVFCKGFESGKVKSRYKKIDVTNRIKLFEDAFSEATGIDDCQNFVFTAVKAWSDNTAAIGATDVWVWKRPEDNPIDSFLGSVT